MEEKAMELQRSEKAGFQTASGFELIQRQAKVLAASQLVPKEYQSNVANCIIGLEIAHRIGVSPLAVLQNLYLVHGKPGWSSQFIIAAINSTGKFSPLRFDLDGTGEKLTCAAWATDLATGDRLEGPRVSIDMAKKEGWFSKSGSKWQTMPELMIRYRAATFFGRLYAPEILMGMQTADELTDVAERRTKADDVAARFVKPDPAAVTVEAEEPAQIAGEELSLFYDDGPL